MNGKKIEIILQNFTPFMLFDETEPFSYWQRRTSLIRGV